MAELAKKLQVKVSGTTTPCKIYSTSAEAGTSYVRAKVDNVEAYIPLVDASDGRASKVHIGSKCIATTGKPPYTEKSWTTAGTYTFTVPAGVTRMRVAVCGGGGGGRADTNNGTAASGGASSIKNTQVLINATGGGGGRTQRKLTQVGDNVEYKAYGYAGTGGTPNGRSGDARDEQFSGGSVRGGTGFALSFTLVNGTYGQGGGASCSTGYYDALGGGGSGGYDTNYIDVTPLETLTITVGAGGGNGTCGFVLIAYGGDI